MSVRIGSIVMHCNEFERTVAFWQDALHYVPREPARNGWVVLRDPEGKGPNLSFQARDTRRERRSWLHLDLYADDKDGEVERLVKLGARRYPWRYRPHSDFVVLEDPGGTLFLCGSGFAALVWRRNDRAASNQCMKLPGRAGYEIDLVCGRPGPQLLRYPLGGRIETLVMTTIRIRQDSLGETCQRPDRFLPPGERAYYGSHRPCPILRRAR